MFNNIRRLLGDNCSRLYLPIALFVLDAFGITGSCFIDIRLALAEIVLIILAVPALKLSEAIIIKYERIRREIQDQVISIIMEYVDGITTFRSYNMTSEKFADC